MKLYNIKKTLAVATLAMATTGFTSCVNDLDCENPNPKEVADFASNALLNKIYSSFVLTSGTGPGDSEIPDVDAGVSGFYRMVFYLNELPTDEAVWYWSGDAGVPALQDQSWGNDNDNSFGMYYRLGYTITLCNHFLDNGGSAMDRAEVRFIRALNFFYMMDFYGGGPLATAISMEAPKYASRAELFKFVESELLDIRSSLAEPGKNTYGRVDRVAADLLLARLYLNAEVYTGTAQWAKAKEYAEKVISNGHYKLCETGKKNPVTGEEYSAYQLLFMGDNDRNGAQVEAILPLINDGMNTQSYACATFLTHANYSSDMDIDVPSGTNTSWGKCMAVKGALLKLFYGEDLEAGLPSSFDELKSVKGMTAKAVDDRALFYGLKYKDDKNHADPYVITPYIDELYSQECGFSCVKFRNLNSDGTEPVAKDFSSINVPLLRVAEAYLTYAEAEARLNNGVVTSDAVEKINVLRKRANAKAKSEYSLADIRDEWAREFWFEGRRRMDLVRFNSFGGQSEYKWEFMGGVAEGTQFPATRNIYGIPTKDLNGNPNMTGHQNPGY